MICSNGKTKYKEKIKMYVVCVCQEQPATTQRINNINDKKKHILRCSCVLNENEEGKNYKLNTIRWMDSESL